MNSETVYVSHVYPKAVAVEPGKPDVLADELALAVSKWWGKTNNHKGTPIAVTLLPGPEDGFHGDDAEVRARGFAVAHLAREKASGLVVVHFTGEVEFDGPGVAKTRLEADKAAAKMNALWDKGVANLKNAKSLTVGCKQCGSKVARKYLTGIDCPVCQGRLLSDGANKAYEAAAVAAREYAELLRRDNQKAVVRKAGTFLLVVQAVPPREVSATNSADDIPDNGSPPK